MSWYQFLAPFWGQNITWVFSNLRVFTFYKSMMVVQIGSVCQKLRNFTDQNGSKGGPHENKFWWMKIKMNVTNTVEKVDEKMRSFVWFLSFFPELWPLICLEKRIFYNFPLTSARNPSLLKQLAYFIRKFSLHSFRKWYG